MAPPQGSSKHGGSQDSSQLSDDSGVQQLIAARAKEAKAAKALHERAKESLQRAQGVTVEYEKKVGEVLSGYKGALQSRVREQKEEEKTLRSEWEQAQKEVVGLMTSCSDLLDKLTISAVREADKLTKDLEANTERLAFFDQQEEQGIVDAVDHFWDLSDDEGQGEGGGQGSQRGDGGRM